MAIKVRIKPGNIYRVESWSDDLTNTNISYAARRSTNNDFELSDDLTGLDCTNVIKAIKDGILELAEGYLGIEGLSDTVAGANENTHNFITIANRRVSEIDIYNAGPNDIEIKFDDATNGVFIGANQTFSKNNLTIPITTVKVSIIGGAGSSTYYIVVE